MVFKMRGFSPFHQEKTGYTGEKVGRALVAGKDFERHGFEIGEEKHAFRSNLTFSQAFRAARDAGAKTFWWKGHKKTTKLA